MINFDNIRDSVKKKPSISKEHFLGIINKMQQEISVEMQKEGRIMNIGKVYRPKAISKYDLISSIICGLIHPCIVIKATKDYVYSVSLSSTEGQHNVYTIQNSRMFEGKFVTNTVIRTTQEEAISRFMGIFDNRKEADKAFAIVRNFYKDLFKL